MIPSPRHHPPPTLLTGGGDEIMAHEDFGWGAWTKHMMYSRNGEEEDRFAMPDPFKGEWKITVD